MDQQKILELIQASQTTLKQELLPKHTESRYNLLMLQRSFEILKHYVEVQEHIQSKQLEIFQQHFKFPVNDTVQGMEQLCHELRAEFDADTLNVLQQLNQLELDIVAVGKNL